MYYQEHPPHPGLQKHLKCYWTLEISAALPSSAGQHFLAEGLEFSFNFADPIEVLTQASELAILRQSCICGPMTQPLRLRPTRRVEIFGVCFRPGGAYPFFPYPANELRNGYAEIDDLWGSKSLGIVDRIHESCHTTGERIDLLDRHFLQQLDHNQRKDPCLAAALEAMEVYRGQVNIDYLARLVGLSGRQLERRFKEWVGLSPKQLCRSLRFKHLFKRLANSRGDSWVSTALTCGYYDQSHMIRDFRHFTGTSPAAYFTNRPAVASFFTGNF